MRIRIKVNAARVCSVVLAGLVMAALVPAAAVAQDAQHQVQAVTEAPASDGTMNAPASRAIEQGYLVPDQAEYDRAKADAAGTGPRADQPAEPDGAASPLAPVTNFGFNGIFNANVAPSDSTGSVGSTRYMELINSNFAIYNKTSAAPVGTGTLNQLSALSGNAFDPQVIWDAQTNRFYYTMDVVQSATANLLAIGFSKTATPTTAADFCHYNISFGSNFPDYPKLGDSSNFWMIGSNIYNSANTFIGSDLFALTKPAAGATCPAASTFKSGEKFPLTVNAAGTKDFTPVPANQIDPSNTGYVVARNLSLPSTSLWLHNVTPSGTGTPVIQNPAVAVTVPSYTIPANAPQKSPSPKQLDTSDTRPTQAVSAIDPGHANSVGLWTQHTTFAATGRSEVRWYEINPVTRALFQSGKATSTAYSAFNGAISPDRRRNGTTVQFGNSMVLNFDTSGTASFPAVRQLSKIGAGAQSGHVLVHASPGNYAGFDCAASDNICRWGDYAAASPEPVLASGATKGRVWGTSQFASGGTSTAQANWRTWNWVATP